MKTSKLKLVLVVWVLTLAGCPLNDESRSTCEKVMVCNEDKESLCDPAPTGQNCGEDICHYYTTETCWEECKQDVEFNEVRID